MKGSGEGGHGHWAASLGKQRKGITLIIGTFSASPALVLGKHDHLARMISFAHLANLRQVLYPPHMAEKGMDAERGSLMSEGTQLIHGGGRLQ